MGRRFDQPSGPSLQHIAKIDDRAANRRTNFDYFAIAQSDLETAFTSTTDYGFRTKVGVAKAEEVGMSSERLALIGKAVNDEVSRGQLQVQW